MKTNPPSFAISQTAYGTLLWAYPRAHRLQYGTEMAHLFRDQCRDAWRRSGMWGLTMLWTRTVPDFALTCIAERLASLKERKTVNDKISDLSRFQMPRRLMLFQVFFLVFLAVLVLSVVITFLLPNSYRAEARIRVEPDSPAAERSNAGVDPYFTQTEMGIISSEVVLEPVIRQLKLNEQWGKKYFNGETLNTTETLQLLRQRLQVRPLKNTAMLEITVYSDDRQEPADIANAIAQMYMQYRVQCKYEAVESQFDSLQKQYDEESARIQDKETELGLMEAKFRQESPNSSTPPPVYLQKKRELEYLLDFHKALFTRIETARLARSGIHNPVQIIDSAQAARAPSKPNKPLNILLGAFLGGCLGLLAALGAAAICYLATKRERRRLVTA